MTELDIEFLEEYKAVERICNDMYGVNSGVTEYITSMECADGYKTLAVARWNDMLVTLKRLRHLRNQIVHGNIGDFEVTEQDLHNLEGFHKALLNQTDPLARLRKTVQQNSATAYAPAQRQATYVSAPPQNTYNVKQAPQVAPDDHPSILMALLAFCLPLVGIIVYVLFEEKKPQFAHSAIKGAIAKWITAFVLVVLYYVVVVLIIGAGMF